MEREVVRAVDVRKQFFRKGRESARHFDAVAGASLALSAGEFVELVGRSGGGKSTLLNMLAGLSVPTEGSVECCGSDLYAMSDGELSKFRNEHFGIVPQGQTALHNLTVVQNVKLPHLMYRPDDGIDGRAMELLERLGIADLSESYPSELSGGELRRMAIARALVCKPPIVLADEPTGDLDDENTTIVLETLRAVADAGAAVLVVTHEQAAARYADRIVRMDAGRIVEECKVV